MAKEVLANFEGYCPVNDCPKSFSVTYVERGDGLWERRDKRDCDYKGLFNPRGCVDCDLIKTVQQVMSLDEIEGEPVEEYRLFEKLAAWEESQGEA